MCKPSSTETVATKTTPSIGSALSFITALIKALTGIFNGKSSKEIDEFKKCIPEITSYIKKVIDGNRAIMLDENDLDWEKYQLAFKNKTGIKIHPNIHFFLAGNYITSYRVDGHGQEGPWITQWELSQIDLFPVPTSEMYINLAEIKSKVEFDSGHEGGNTTATGLMLSSIEPHYIVNNSSFELKGEKGNYTIHLIATDGSGFMTYGRVSDDDARKLVSASR